MSVDSIGNFLTIIRNGVKVSNPYVITPLSKMNKEIAQILESEGFIKGFDQIDQDGFKKLKIFLKYVNGESAIHELDRVSKLSRRSYAGVGEVKPVIGGLGISILTTNRGVVTHKQAKKLGVGGEIICTVW
jgi:small subunit ribosomal protein S8